MWGHFPLVRWKGRFLVPFSLSLWPLVSGTENSRQHCGCDFCTCSAVVCARVFLVSRCVLIAMAQSRRWGSAGRASPSPRRSPALSPGSSDTVTLLPQEMR